MPNRRDRPVSPLARWSLGLAKGHPCRVALPAILTANGARQLLRPHRSAGRHPGPQQSSTMLPTCWMLRSREEPAARELQRGQRGYGDREDPRNRQDERALNPAVLGPVLLAHLNELPAERF